VANPGLGQGEAGGRADQGGAGQGGDVAEQVQALGAETGRLDGAGLEHTAYSIGGQESEGLALHLLGHQQQRPAGLGDLLQEGQQVVDGRQLAIQRQDIGPLQYAKLALGVVDEIG
jgi:hypothetical protein